MRKGGAVYGQTQGEGSGNDGTEVWVGRVYEMGDWAGG